MDLASSVAMCDPFEPYKMQMVDALGAFTCTHCLLPGHWSAVPG